MTVTFGVHCGSIDTVSAAVAKILRVPAHRVAVVNAFARATHNDCAAKIAFLSGGNGATMSGRELGEAAVSLVREWRAFGSETALGPTLVASLATVDTMLERLIDRHDAGRHLAACEGGSLALLPGLCPSAPKKSAKRARRAAKRAAKKAKRAAKKAKRTAKKAKRAAKKAKRAVKKASTSMETLELSEYSATVKQRNARRGRKARKARMPKTLASDVVARFDNLHHNHKIRGTVLFTQTSVMVKLVGLAASKSHSVVVHELPPLAGCEDTGTAFPSTAAAVLVHSDQATELDKTLDISLPISGANSARGRSVVVLQDGIYHPVACAPISYGGQVTQIKARFTHALIGTVVFSQVPGGETSVLVSLGHADMEGLASENSKHDWHVHEQGVGANDKEDRCTAVGALWNSGDLGQALGHLVISNEMTRRFWTHPSLQTASLVGKSIVVTGDKNKQVPEANAGWRAAVDCGTIR